LISLKHIFPIEEVPLCVHGIYLKRLNSVKRNGLNNMKLYHVHFERGLSINNDLISGMPSDCQVSIYLDVENDLQDGMNLYVSKNKVILAKGFNGVLPHKYFTKIETIEQKKNKRY
jgi:RNA:NAD 2'-phosphotransferase (TPT1/KptA family)